MNLRQLDQYLDYLDHPSARAPALVSVEGDAMKFRVTFKDPDKLHDAIEEATTAEVDAMQPKDQEERESLIDIRTRKAHEKVAKFFRYGEYVTVECDTEAGTAVVVPDGA